MIKNLSMLLGLFIISLMSQEAIAGPVVVDGVRYNDEAQARVAIQRSMDVRLASYPKNYLETINVNPIGGRYIVELPTLEESRLKYVAVSGGLFRPGRKTQNLVAESVIANIKVVFLKLERIGFIDAVEFIESDQEVVDENYDYLIRFQTNFDGDRSPQAGQFRQVNWLIRRGDLRGEHVALTAYGAPYNTSELMVFSGLRSAVEALSQGSDLRPENDQSRTLESGSTLVASEGEAGQVVMDIGETQSNVASRLPQGRDANSDNQSEGQIRINERTEEQASSEDDIVLDRAISRCEAIGFVRGTSDYRECVTEQIDILSR